MWDRNKRISLLENCEKSGKRSCKIRGVAWNKPLHSFSDSILDKQENDVQCKELCLVHTKDRLRLSKEGGYQFW